jgi:very-short-patch-repair endonuclease
VSYRGHKASTGHTDYAPADYNDGRSGIYAIDSLRNHDTHPDVLEWALRRGIVVAGEEVSRYGVAPLLAAQVAHEFRSDVFGYRDAMRAAGYIISVSPRRSWAPGLLLLDVHGFFAHFALVRDPVRQRRWRHHWDESVFADRGEQDTMLRALPYLIPSVRNDNDVARLCESEPERVFARTWAAAALTRDERLIPQYPVRQYRIDFYAPARSAAIEVDGAAYHTGPEQVAADADRDAALVGLGIRTVRVAAAAVLRDPVKLVEAVYRQVTP